MGVPGSKIWSNLQLLSLFQSKYLKCDDCYDDNDGSQMMIMMAVRASEWTRAVVTSSQHQEKYEIS